MIGCDIIQTCKVLVLVIFEVNPREREMRKPALTWF